MDIGGNENEMRGTQRGEEGKGDVMAEKVWGASFSEIARQPSREASRIAGGAPGEYTVELWGIPWKLATRALGNYPVAADSPYSVMISL